MITPQQLWGYYIKIIYIIAISNTYLICGSVAIDLASSSSVGT